MTKISLTGDVYTVQIVRQSPSRTPYNMSLALVSSLTSAFVFGLKCILFLLITVFMFRISIKNVKKNKKGFALIKTLKWLTSR